jgi:leader peptidase (prepilin peptidase)/N-methyltransferase
MMNDELLVLTHAPGLVLAVVLGLLWGSFANVCIYRWPPTDEFPNGRSVVAPGSHCFACKVPVRWYDNVPMASWLWLRGRCRNCKAPFSARYLIVEGATAALFGVAWWFTLGNGGLFEALDVRALWFVVDAAFVWVMIVIFFIDLDHMLILDKLTYPAAILFYAVTFALPGYRWWDGLVGAIVGYGVPWLIGEIWIRVRKIEGIGLGDSTMLMVVGALLGWKGVVAALFGGSVIGTIFTLTAMAAGRRAETEQSEDSADTEEQAGEEARGALQTEVPFGPYLAMAALFYLFAAPWIDLHFRL